MHRTSGQTAAPLQHSQRTLRVALIGNPNTGKSTLFNALSGMRQRVGNYPGVTVEKKTGQFACGDQQIELIDLPGTYSLAPRSLDEMVAVDVLLGTRRDEPPIDAVICIVDAANLERNLYLVSQVMELGLPTLLALNMMDVARTRGIEIDVERLSRQLQLPIVPLQAHKGSGFDGLRGKLQELLKLRDAAPSPAAMPAQFLNEVELLSAKIDGEQSHTPKLPRFLVERLLLDTSGYLAESEAFRERASLHDQVAAARQRLRSAGLSVPGVEAMSRYAWAAKSLEGAVKRPAVRPATFGDRLDRVLTHRVWGTLVFIALMIVIFQAVFNWAGPAMDVIDTGFAELAAGVESLLPEGALRSLLVDGILGGVAGVLVFLPQIFILFFFIAVLEDCGYMARAAYLMDRLMVRVGLSGKSFIPMLSSFACAVPGIMAARVIEHRRDRLTTIMVAPLMSCSARLPVYTIMIAAFIPDRPIAGGLLGLQGLTMVSMYAVGIIAAAGVALVLKRSLLRGATPPFVMELPSYKWPSLRLVLLRMWERGWAFVKRAGTLIVAVSIIVWAALYYPHPEAQIEGPFAQRRAELEQTIATSPADSPAQTEAAAELDEIAKQIAGQYQRQSILGRMGHWIEPVVRPLGWDWRIGCAVIASFPAREVVVATLGVIYNLGGELDIESEGDARQLETALHEAKWDGTSQPVYNVAVALSIMVFFALCAQCAATLAVIRRETQSWRWPVFAFTYMTGLAYVAALVTYQVAIRFA